MPVPLALEQLVGIVAALGLEHLRQLRIASFDRAVAHGGSYFPTYNRYALRRQVDACYPQLQEFLKLKLKYDPQKLFQSEWYRHYERMYEKK